MSKYDYLEEAGPERKTSAVIINILTVLILMTVMCITIVFLTIFINPYSGLNPFPPPTLPAAISFPTSTPTPRNVLPPTWTPLPTDEPTLTFTPPPTSTATPLPPTDTPFPLFTPSPTISGTVVTGGMPFIVGAGTPVATSSIAFHPEEGCNWLGVSGQVFDLSGASISGQQVRIGGTLAGAQIDMLSLTGLTNAYGSPGFYEFNLGDKPLISKGTLWLQLLDQAGIAMSDKVYFDTYGECEKNLIFVNFKQVR